MGNIKIIKGVFDSSLELVHAEVAAGFPDITVDYAHETLDFNHDYIKHPEASFYGDVKADVFANAIKHDFRSPNPTTRWSDVIQLNSNAKKRKP